jgi:hypothetical protein
MMFGCFVRFVAALAACSKIPGRLANRPPPPSRSSSGSLGGPLSPLCFGVSVDGYEIFEHPHQLERSREWVTVSPASGTYCATEAIVFTASDV